MYLDFIESIHYSNSLMHHYADRCCINLDNWSIFQQHNWHNYAWFFCFHDDNENEAMKAHTTQHRDSKTKKPRHQNSKTKKPRHRDSNTKKLRHRETEINKPWHRESKMFFQRTINHEKEMIPRLKNHDIKFQWNSDPYAPWYFT